MQGYLFSRPLPLPDLEALLQTAGMNGDIAPANRAA
jgi:EAL domain-containing protein (putative c-di-GMP-specific phosphodiesterase class I)